MSNNLAHKITYFDKIRRFTFLFYRVFSDFKCNCVYKKRNTVDMAVIKKSEYNLSLLKINFFTLKNKMLKKCQRILDKRNIRL